MASVYALVLARGGSKGLPGKNVRLLGGHPLIAWSIAAARASGVVDRVVCSTDCKEIATIARKYGADVPFMRPAELASDSATDLDVFEHALSWLDDHGESPNLIVQLRPTTPFRHPSWIDTAVERMIADSKITCVRSVTCAEPTPYKMWSLSADGERLLPLLTVEGMIEPYNMPRQKLPVAYWHTGQLDVIRSDTIRAGSMTGTQIAPLQVDRDMAIDIDTLRDFQLAELAFDETMPATLRHGIAEAPSEISQ